MDEWKRVTYADSLIKQVKGLSTRKDYRNAIKAYAGMLAEKRACIRTLDTTRTKTCAQEAIAKTRCERKGCAASLRFYKQCLKNSQRELSKADRTARTAIRFLWNYSSATALTRAENKLYNISDEQLWGLLSEVVRYSGYKEEIARFCLKICLNTIGGALQENRS